jgi:hypothetical protein
MQFGLLRGARWMIAGMTAIALLVVLTLHRHQNSPRNSTQINPAPVSSTPFTNSAPAHSYTAGSVLQSPAPPPAEAIAASAAAADAAASAAARISAGK